MKFSMREFWNMSGVWSLSTFGGYERGPEGPLKHLAKEVNEALDKPKDLTEYADIMHLAFDACRRAGYEYDELVAACYAKLAVNKNRKWKEPDSSGVCEHVEGT